MPIGAFVIEYHLVKHMQATLVAYYGKKPAALSNLIREVQGKLIGVLSDAYFYQYDIEQVHSTIIGMEGVPKDKTIINKNFQALRGELRPMDVDNAVKFIRTTSMMPMRIRVGGFKESTNYGFESFGVHPYHRSFSIQGEIAVIMGWPVTNSGTHCMSLHQLRYQFQRHNILHKYHKTDGDIDNDLYFVVGRVSSNIVNTALKRQGEECLRAYLASIEPITIPLTHEDISIVCYRSDLLPQNTSVCLPITGESLDGLQSMLSINSSL
jgi:hypothetical protein